MALVDTAKKIDKAREQLGIPPDERILMACMANPRGTVGAMAAGGLIGAAIRSKVDKDAAAAAGDGMAGGWPGGRNMLAITDRRLLLCKISTMSGKPTDVAASWSHADIAGIEVEKGKTAYPFVVVFHDGSAAKAEGARGSGADQLADVVARIWPT